VSGDEGQMASPENDNVAVGEDRLVQRIVEAISPNPRVIRGSSLLTGDRLSGFR
jgi:hypothetical protein